MQEKDYAQIYEFGLGSLIGDFFQNVKDTVTGVAKTVAPIAPFVLPFVAPGIGNLIGGSIGNFIGSRLGQAAIGAGIGALAGQKPSEIAKNLALQTATSGIAGVLGTNRGQGTIGERFMSGVKGVELPKVEGVATDKTFIDKVVSAINPADRAINPEFTKTKKIAEITGNPLTDDEIISLGIPKESSFTYQYTPALYTGLTAASAADQFLGPKTVEEEGTSVREDLYTPNYAQYQLLDITGPEGLDPLLVAEGGEITGFSENGGKKIQHPDGDTKEHPKRIGEIVGPGTGTSDDIPAMLSDGEFVMTAQAVRNAGGGSRKEGAKNMYKMMKSLEKGGSLSQQSIGMA
jgi:hypothetical protein